MDGLRIYIGRSGSDPAERAAPTSRRPKPTIPASLR